MEKQHKIDQIRSVRPEIVTFSSKIGIHLKPIFTQENKGMHVDVCFRGIQA